MRFTIHKILIIIFLCVSLQGWAQEKSNTLHTEYSKNYQSLPNKSARDVHRLIDSAELFMYRRPDSARIMLKEAFHMAQSINYDRGMANALMTYAAVYDEIGKPDTALEYYKRALVYALKVPSSQTALVEMIQNNIAMDYAYMGVYKEATEYFYNAIANADTSKPFIHLYNNIATVLGYLDENEKVMQYLQQGKAQVMLHPRERYMLPYFYINEAEALLKMGYPDSAKKSVENAIMLAHGTSALKVLEQAYTVTGSIYEKKNMPMQAIQWYRKVYGMNSNYLMGHMRSCISLGRVYLALQRYDSSDKYLQQALAITTQLKMPQEQAEVYNALGKVYFATHRYAEAYKYEQMGNLLYDSTMTTDRMRFVNLMEIKYQATVKDKELAEKKLTIATQHTTLMRKNTLIWGISIGLILLVVFFFLFYRYRSNLQKKHEEITSWRAMSEGEEKERTRMARELHDGIGGSLSTLKMYLGTIEKRHSFLSDTKDYNEAMQLLDNTLAEVRQTAHNLMPELLLRHGLPEAVRIFCSNIPATTNLKIDFQYYGFIGALNSNFELAVYRIIQELVQNIIKHAQATFAVVQLSQHDNIFSVTVEDNGIGMDTKHAPATGLGLQSIRRRITELNGTFSLTSSEKGTVAYFEFNMQNQKNISV